MFATNNDQDAVAHLLMTHGANVSLKDFVNDIDALMIAVQKGNCSLVQDLISKGADINVRGVHGWSPLLLAQWYEHDDIVQLLRSQNANEEHMICEQDLQFLKTVEQDITDSLRLIVEGANVNARFDDGDTALIRAVSSRSLDKVKMLIDHGANVNLRGCMHDTALMKAAESGDMEIATMLLEHGAAVNEQNFLGETALMKACKEGNQSLVELLLNHDADVSLEDKHGETALNACWDEELKEFVQHFGKEK
eukprot:TRINITY_DN3396_c0_g1_i11.p1 TRINITY_DN3396_c0_g1~~TRINITY_DN3396_c0_g1_i11.p1  ORF type:complete len:251 (+),score=60.93 TRINITY_DN3396_c0_g1_i11:129-881(+)